jgi:phosphopentomutase
MLYGHRSDVDGYADALEELDSWIPELIAALREDALLVFTADHGCDPSFPGSDHTRENVPLLCYSPGIRPVDLGLRSSFADLAATLAELLRIPSPADGISFAEAVL